MPNRLHRHYGAGYSHFITISCYRRLPLLASPQSRDLFLRVLESVRRRYHFVVAGYVVMPEHVHLLISRVPHFSRVLCARSGAFTPSPTVHGYTGVNFATARN